MEISLNERENDIAAMEMSSLTTNAVFDDHGTPFDRR
jgi:hypothetical protein